jgi:hypothetical protein
MNANMTQAQTDNDFAAEEFLAEVYYGWMTEKSPEVYIEKHTYLPEMYGYIYRKSKSGDKKFDYNKFCEICNICDTTIVDELYEYIRKFDIGRLYWNENAPVFQLPEYKNLIFVEDISKLSKRERKKMEQRHFSQPLFTKNYEYALVSEEHYNHIVGSHGSAGYNVIYKKIDNKWVEIGRYLTTIS